MALVCMDVGGRPTYSTECNEHSNKKFLINGTVPKERLIILYKLARTS